MNFFDMCYELFMRTSKYHDLGKDVLNYNKVTVIKEPDALDAEPMNL